MTAVGMKTLRPGDIGFGPIGGFVPGFFPVRVGQWLLARTSRKERKINHVFVVVDDSLDRGGRAAIVQAMPSGAEYREIGAEHWTPEYVYVRPNYSFPLDQAYRVAEAACAYVGTPYSFLDYAAIFGLHLGVRNGPIRRYVTTSKHMICSQLADQAMADAGFHVFDDGRLPQDVMPAELYRALIAMPGTQVIRPS